MARTHKFIDEMSDLAKLSGFRSAGGFKNPLSEKSGIRTADIRGYSAQPTKQKPDIRMAADIHRPYFWKPNLGQNHTS